MLPNLAHSLDRDFLFLYIMAFHSLPLWYILLQTWAPVHALVGMVKAVSFKDIIHSKTVTSG